MAKTKVFIPALLIASMLAIPTVASAHGNGPLTRDQVHAELVQLRQAGYHGSVDSQYPADLQAAMGRVGAQQQASANSGYGGVSTGSSARGAPAHQASAHPIADHDHSIYRGS
ncbi:hypothetical protein OKW30_003495 [Paraburkholderia sp. Clong3]|uniref:DUF4148 domain-containing protein n=1 Tax=Paraburkholderia sp. Clong3 TaxID=2991061 RepID=UPI003D190FA8